MNTSSLVTPHIQSRVEGGPSLPHDDISWYHMLTCEQKSDNSIIR